MQHKFAHEAGILSFRPQVDILVVGQQAVVTQRKTSRVEEWLYVVTGADTGADMAVEKLSLKSEKSMSAVAAAV